MPKIIRKLTETEARNAPAKEKPYKLYDEGGLRLLVRPSGTKTWQVPYTYRNKANIFTIGQYSHVERAGTYKMTEARKIRDEVKACVARGENPKTTSANVSFAQHSGCNGTLLDKDTFKAVAREWHAKGVWVPKHSKSILKSLERDVFPHIGDIKITDIKPMDIVEILEKVEERGALDVAHRVSQRCTAIFEYAIVKGLCDSNPALGRARLIKKKPVKHRPHLKEYSITCFSKGS